MRDGDTMLIMVKGGEVIHFTPNMSLPHSEFVKRMTGQLPEGAWVGTGEDDCLCQQNVNGTE